MKPEEFDIFFYCGRCKEPLKTHSKYAFGKDCPSKWVDLENED